MKCSYMTIEREYGSGGTRIARRLSEACQIPCYGREILEAVAQNRNVSVEQLQKYEERATNSFLYTVFLMSRMQSGSADMLTDEAMIYLDEQMEIQKLAKSSGRAIFLGHCASEALKDQPGVVKVFIRSSSEEEKRRRIREDYGIAEEDIEATRRFYDKKRSTYYLANTSKNWHDFSNYDIVLDSAVLGIEGCVSLLKELFLVLDRG